MRTGVGCRQCGECVLHVTKSENKNQAEALLDGVPAPNAERERLPVMDAGEIRITHTYTPVLLINRD